ncbi:MAG: uracil-xanthine permease family protein [Oscillospiraceae bacterium]
MKKAKATKPAKAAKSKIGEEGIYDARELGAPKMFILGLQHMFAMFGATVLVPTLTGLSVSTTLLFAGLGTLLFHLISKGKVPAFLGSSFAFLAGYWAIAPMLNDPATGLPTVANTELLPYACLGVAVAGLMYVILSGLFKVFGAQKVMRFFPPIVTGPIIISIGLTLSSSAVKNCQSNWWIALVAIVVIIVFNIWGKGMFKIIPILLGVAASYIIAALTNNVDFSGVISAPWFGLPIERSSTVLAVFDNPNVPLIITSIITIVPLALATMVEHIGDMCAISSTCKRNYLEDPGLHRTLLGDGLATTVASLFGAPANTTYGENTGVLVLSKVYDPRVIRIAALIAILVSFCPKFSALISAMPVATIGGVSLVLYGMISAVGVRNIVENKVDFTKSRNVIIAALILVLSIGISYGPGSISFPVGDATISLSGLAVAALVGIILNAILPGKDYVFGADALGDTSVDFKV